LFLKVYVCWLVAADKGKPVIADDNHATERLSLNKVQIDDDAEGNNSSPKLDLTGSTDHDADESEVSTEPDVDDSAANRDSTLRKRKKISTLLICFYSYITDLSCVVFSSKIRSQNDFE